ncbi:hypothetical protein [Thalassotalea hakodatensis]|uniref:hypothetical protein n=1 Tax=Thalassotalea hakodatensis TaxID=3030492 RepID=UPI0025728BB4|nr:hypothetical protein [Thalassotalea hakodatensis]
MQISKEAKDSLLFLVSELHAETKIAKSASIMNARKHVERVADLQNRFNATLAKALCYGE